jgi:hypothetical protein
VKHLWPTIEATIASLKSATTGLPARVTAFNAEGSHGVTLTAPEDDRYFPGGHDLLSDGSFPAVEVHIATGGIGPFAVGNTDADVDDRVVVVVWAEGDKGEIPVLYETIVGLGRCALEVLLVEHAFGASVDISNQERAVTYDYSIVPGDPSDEAARTFEKWRTACVLTFQVEDVTSIP